MDVEEFYKNINFSVIYKEKNCYILEALVDHGNTYLVRVLSLNNTPLLKNMKWKKLWVLDHNKASTTLPLQFCCNDSRFCREKSLTIQDNNLDSSIYMHNTQSFIVTFVNDNPDDRFTRDDRLTLLDCLSVGNVEIRRFD